MNAIEYVYLLDQVLLPSISAVYGDANVNLQEVINIIEDNSSVHTADIVKQWYQEQPFLNRLPLPARSPELNIIENVWAEMVRTWRPSMARTHEELMFRVDKAWGELRNRPDYLKNSTDSMQKRLENIIQVDGANINY